MSSDQSQRSVTPDFTHPAFTAVVTPNPDGGWLTILTLRDGATLSKWFQDEERARRYPDELAGWLNRKQMTH